MKVTLSITLSLFVTTLLAQAYSDRYEAVGEDPHTLSDFNLHGAVKSVSTKQYKSDENGELVLDEYAATTVQEFSKTGKLLSTLILKNNGDTLSYVSYAYDKADNLNQKTGEYGWKTNYTYGDSGITSAIKKVKETVYERHYKYDEQGRLISDKYSYMGSPEFEDIYTYEGKTDQIKKCELKRFDTEPFDFSAVAKYEYHPNGAVKSFQKIMNVDEYAFRGYTQFFDEHGNMTEAIGGDSINKKSFDHIHQTFDELNNIVSKKAYHIYTGEGDAKEHTTHTYTYDKKDNWTEKISNIAYQYSIEGHVLTEPEEVVEKKEKQTRVITYY
ncbi:hypothetical protein [Parvicella tangerina]|uniref:RHS repeat protein n=1 Tax=Parvicella tangerina TaxID=2829795 RepID=A0A916NHQ1_9FLAO|nr:hypothetical protein [Parvicella tangerina]CAG5082101.1 hypothetical protein CRYO30217_01808 [Parvicella tangerina]